MFSRQKRLSRAQFPSALKSGQRVSSEHFSAIIPHIHSAPEGAYAVVVSKKIARLSVTRHRIKRQILGALQSFPVLPPALIIFPKPSALRLDSLHIRADLALLLGKISPQGRLGAK